jgi:hypothetical protein
MHLSYLSGQLLLEVIVVVAILSIVGSTILLLITSQLSNVTNSKKSSQALFLAEEGMEAARMIRDMDWDSLATGTYGLVYENDMWGFVGTSDTTNGFMRSVTVSELFTNERQVDVDISWEPEGERTIEFTLSTVLANWRNLLEDLLLGDWTNPQTLGTIDMGAGAAGTGVDVKSSMAYMTSEASSEAKDDFFIIDLTDGMNPVLRGSVDTADGLYDVKVSGQYAYVAVDPKYSDTAQFQAIDVSDPDNPFVAGSVSLTGDNTQSGRTIALAGSYAYVGVDVLTGDEFYIVDISDPLNPTVVGSYDVTATVNGIAIKDNYAYLATGLNNAELMVLDVTTSTNPVLEITQDLSGDNDALDVYINSQDDRMYIGRDKSSAAGAVELNILDVSDPTTPITLSEYDYGFGINTILAADELLFTATDKANLEFQIYDVTDPLNVTYYSGMNFPQVAVDFSLENNTIYTAVRSNDALRIITSQ